MPRPTKDGLLRAEGTAGLKVTMARRDRVIADLENRLKGDEEFGKYKIDITGPSCFRVYCEHRATRVNVARRLKENPIFVEPHNVRSVSRHFTLPLPYILLCVVR